MDDAVIVSLLQQVVDGLGSIQSAVEEVGRKVEEAGAYLGERVDDARAAVAECRERVDMEGSHVQDRINELKSEVASLPAAIGSYLQ